MSKLSIIEGIFRRATIENFHFHMRPFEYYIFTHRRLTRFYLITVENIIGSLEFAYLANLHNSIMSRIRKIFFDYSVNLQKLECCRMSFFICFFQVLKYSSWMIVGFVLID